MRNGKETLMAARTLAKQHNDIELFDDLVRVDHTLDGLVRTFGQVQALQKKLNMTLVDYIYKVQLNCQHAFKPSAVSVTRVYCKFCGHDIDDLRVRTFVDRVMVGDYAIYSRAGAAIMSPQLKKVLLGEGLLKPKRLEVDHGMGSTEQPVLHDGGLGPHAAGQDTGGLELRTEGSDGGGAGSN